MEYEKILPWNFLRYKHRTGPGQCDAQTSIVSVTCVHDSFALCQDNEIPWKGSCYSLNFNRSTFDQASQFCQNEGKKLIEVDNQVENDLISELLLHSKYSFGLLSHVWTGGKAQSNGRRRAPTLFWTASSNPIGGKYWFHGKNVNLFREINFTKFLIFAGFKKWWEGWQGKKVGNTQMEENRMGISLQRKFKYQKAHQSYDERLIDYYFWALENLNTKLPFICERAQKDIGCINDGNGENYYGNANRGETGDICESWNSAFLSSILEPDKIQKLGDLNNNFCRNPDGDVAPWCIAPNGEFDYCDIPKCSDNENNQVQ